MDQWKTLLNNLVGCEKNAINKLQVPKSCRGKFLHNVSITFANEKLNAWRVVFIFIVYCTYTREGVFFIAYKFSPANERWIPDILTLIFSRCYFIINFLEWRIFYTPIGNSKLASHFRPSGEASHDKTLSYIGLPISRLHTRNYT